MDNTWMRLAIEQAEQARENGDVPVGAVIVQNGSLLAVGKNRREANCHALGHAELEAIDEACRKKHAWRLDDCDLYVTLEPCSMCAGAIIGARIRRLYFGAYDKNYGAAGGKLNLFQSLSSQTEVYGGIMEDACQAQLDSFFDSIRKK